MSSAGEEWSREERESRRKPKTTLAEKMSRRIVLRGQGRKKKKKSKGSSGGFMRMSSLRECPFYAPMAQGKVKIYALVDPRDQTVRYIGATRKSLGHRLDFHLRKPTNGRTRRWFEDLKSSSERPKIHLLSAGGGAGWEVEEMKWIAWARRYGRLLNIDPGGEYRDENGKPFESAKVVAAAVDRHVKELGAPGRPVAASAALRNISAMKPPARGQITGLAEREHARSTATTTVTLAGGVGAAAAHVGVATGHRPRPHAGQPGAESGADLGAVGQRQANGKDEADPGSNFPAGAGRDGTTR